MTVPVLRFNFAAPEGNPAAKREMVNAALDMAAWGDHRGVAAVSIDEHHVTGHGWSSNPVLTAALFLQRTSDLFLSIDCALGPLWNPVRLAEDIAFVDAISAGRLHTTVGLGYRRVEYAALQEKFEDRGVLMDRLLETLFAAWSGQPDLAEYYAALCRQAGIDPILIMPARVNRGMIYLCEDRDEAWARLGKYILWEAVVYGGWSGQSAQSSMHLPGVQTLDEVRSSGRYRFLTPDQLIAEARDCPDYGSLALHPLVGGMPIDEAWKSLHLLTDQVIPQLQHQARSARQGND